MTLVGEEVACGVADGALAAMITQMGCSLDGDLLVLNDGVWQLVEADGGTRAFSPATGGNDPRAVAEWNGTRFATRRCFVTVGHGPFKTNVRVVGARNPVVNGEYFYVLGGYKNEHDVWFVRSTAGQDVFVVRDGTTTKVMGVAEHDVPMVVDLSISSSEIKAMFKQEQWAHCKRLVWFLRAQLPPGGRSQFRVEVFDVPRENKGRKNKSFVGV